MIRASFSKRGLPVSCFLRWFCKSISRLNVSLALFLTVWLGASFCHQTSAQDVEVYAELELETGTRDGLLTVLATIPDGFHTYALTQPAGGPTRSTLKLDGTGIQLTSDFVPQQEPETHDDEYMGPVEVLRGAVSWVAKVQVSSEVDPAELKTKIDLYAQICTDLTEQCKPPTTYTGKIEFLGERSDLKFPPTTKQIELDQFQPTNSHVLLTGRLFTDDGTKNFMPGDTVTLEITAVPLEAYHFYAYQTKPQPMYLPTMVSLQQPAGWTVAGPTTSVRPTFEDDYPIHDVTTSWRFKIKIPETAAPKQAISMTGGIQIQTGNNVGCDAPRDSRFTATIPMGTDSAAALNFENARNGSVAEAVANGDFAAPTGSGGFAVARETKAGPIKKPDVKFIDMDTPEQIAAMAALYDVDEPVNYIKFADMNQFPVAPPVSRPADQSVPLLWLLLALISGAMISVMVYMVFNRSVETDKTAEQDNDQPVYPRLRQIAFIACLVFSICIIAVGVLLIVQSMPWTTSDETQQAATTNTSTGSITWANWHPGKVNQQLEQNKIVWVNYTAEWDSNSKLNEARIASNASLVERISKMNISLVAVDFTKNDDINRNELARTDSACTPVNLIFPPNYPEEPAIKMETLIVPTDVHKVLDRMEAITTKLNQ